jgi:hypothetical protein
MVLSRDGVSGGLNLELTCDGKDIYEAPKSDFPCGNNTQ